MSKTIGKSRKKEEPSVLARLFSTGLAALFLTENGVRRGLKPLGIPRDASKYLMKQVERRKDEMMSVVRDELHQALSKVPFDRIAKDLLMQTDVELSVRFVPRKSTGLRNQSHRWKSK